MCKQLFELIIILLFVLLFKDSNYTDILILIALHLNYITKE